MSNAAFLKTGEENGISSFVHRENGLTLIHQTNNASPLATLMVTYRVGSKHESYGQTGGAHLLEHMMFKGTPTFNRHNGRSVFQVLQSVGAQVNASTWLDRTNYYELVPTTHLEQAFEIEADRMRNLSLDPDDVAKEKVVVLDEHDRGDNNPIRKLYHMTWSTAFLAHPYRHPTIGWRGDIETATPESLKALYDRYYWPNNATVSVIGDVSEEEALDLADKHFGQIGMLEKGFASVLTREPDQVGTRRFQLRRAGELGSLILAWRSPAATSTTTDALEVCAHVLSSGVNSRLYGRLTDNGITSSVSASVSRLADPGLFSVMAMLSSGHEHNEVETKVIEEVEKVISGGITDAELDRAKQRARASYLFGGDGTFTAAARLNEAIAAGDWRLYAGYVDRISSLTTDDIQQAAKETFRTNSLTVGEFIPIAQEAQ